MSDQRDSAAKLQHNKQLFTITDFLLSSAKRPSSDQLIAITVSMATRLYSIDAVHRVMASYVTLSVSDNVIIWAKLHPDQ